MRNLNTSIHMIGWKMVCTLTIVFAVMLGCDVKDTSKIMRENASEGEDIPNTIHIREKINMIKSIDTSIYKDEMSSISSIERKEIGENLEERIDAVGYGNERVNVSGSINSRSIDAEVQSYTGMNKTMLSGGDMVYSTQGTTFLNSVKFTFMGESHSRAIPEGETQTATEKMILNSLDEPDGPDPCSAEMPPCPKSGRGTLAVEGVKDYFESKGYQVEQEENTGLLKVISDHESGGTSTVMYVDRETRKVQRSAIIGPNGKTLFEHRPSQENY